jgi:hypothetical protein
MAGVILELRLWSLAPAVGRPVKTGNTGLWPGLGLHSGGKIRFQPHGGMSQKTQDHMQTTVGENIPRWDSSFLRARGTGI